MEPNTSINIINIYNEYNTVKKVLKNKMISRLYGTRPLALNDLIKILYYKYCSM